MNPWPETLKDDGSEKEATEKDAETSYGEEPQTIETSRSAQESKRSETLKLSFQETAFDHKAVTFPLSMAQERMWFIEQLSPNSPINNIFLAVELRGELRYQSLTKAVNDMLERHSALRTVIRTIENTPRQFVQEMVSLRDTSRSHA